MYVKGHLGSKLKTSGLKLENSNTQDCSKFVSTILNRSPTCSTEMVEAFYIDQEEENKEK